MCHNLVMDDDNKETPEIDEPILARIVIPGTMSGAEMLADWEEHGCFEVWAEQYKDIGPSKKYADSTEYVNAMREGAEKRPRE